MDKKKKPTIAEKPYTVGLLIANLKLRTQNRAEAERLRIKAEDQADRGEFAEADAAVAQQIAESVVLSEIEDYQRTDVRQVQALCEAESGNFDATTMKLLTARVAAFNKIETHEVYGWLLDHFADAVEAMPAGRKVSGTKNKAKESTYPSPNNYARDRWIYENIEKYTCATLSQKIKAKAKKEKWAIISSRNGFKKAADRYAAFHNYDHHRFPSD